MIVPRRTIYKEKAMPSARLILVCVSIKRGLDLSDVTGSPDIQLQDYLNQFPGISGAANLPSGKRALVSVKASQIAPLKSVLGTLCHVDRVVYGDID